MSDSVETVLLAARHGRPPWTEMKFRIRSALGDSILTSLDDEDLYYVLVETAADLRARYPNASEIRIARLLRQADDEALETAEIIAWLCSQGP